MAMNSQQTEAMPELRVTLFPIVEPFVKGVTGDQWLLLRSGKPDGATLIVVADLVLEVVASLTKAILAAFTGMKTSVSEESIRSSLGDALSQSIAQALDVASQVEDHSVELCAAVISKEVAESVNSALSTPMHTAERVVRPRRLNVMVGHTCTMLKAFAGKIRIGRCQRRTRQRKLSPAPLEKPLVDNEEPRAESPVSVVSLLLGVQEQSSSGDSVIDIRKQKSVEELIDQELRKITDPVLDDLPDQVYALLQEECSLEIANTAMGITALLTQQEENQERTHVGKSTSQQKQKTKCKQGVKLRVKNCLAKRFAKAWIHRMVVKLKKKFHPDPKAETTKSMMSLMSGALTDMLYRHIASGMSHSDFPEPVRHSSVQTLLVPQVHANMYAEIRKQAWRFVSLMSWFVNTQVATQSQRVQQAIMGPEAPFQSEALLERGEALERATLCEERTASPLEVDANRQRDLNRVCVQIFVEKLVTLAFKKSKVGRTFVDDGDIIKSLFDRRLCKKTGSQDMVLARLILKDPELGACILWSVDDRLLNPPQEHRTICRFFRSVGKAISNIWRSVQ
ncbi:Methyl-coenzyme M reductase operon protein D [Dissostichus eleginoides]|uniref:Methyl-coenzyme M reductase operon protein D n=1 Tax=Dissostichus eleginoides TaxID=100907 RepID=A0AAD9CSQ0_DISEL|nr:Methyl-coenzyme M reductase operon protein D [Dissostichus eleginoides]